MVEIKVFLPYVNSMFIEMLIMENFKAKFSKQSKRISSQCSWYRVTWCMHTSCSLIDQLFSKLLGWIVFSISSCFSFSVTQYLLKAGSNISGKSEIKGYIGHFSYLGRIFKDVKSLYLPYNVFATGFLAIQNKQKH